MRLGILAGRVCLVSESGHPLLDRRYQSPHTFECEGFAVRLAPDSSILPLQRTISEPILCDTKQALPTK